VTGLLFCEPWDFSTASELQPVWIMGSAGSGAPLRFRLRRKTHGPVGVNSC